LISELLVEIGGYKIQQAVPKYGTALIGEHGGKEEKVRLEIIEYRPQIAGQCIVIRPMRTAKCNQFVQMLLNAFIQQVLFVTIVQIDRSSI